MYICILDRIVACRIPHCLMVVEITRSPGPACSLFHLLPPLRCKRKFPRSLVT